MTNNSDIGYSVDVVTDSLQIAEWALPGQMEYLESSTFDFEYHLGVDKMEEFLRRCVGSNVNDDKIHKCVVATKWMGGESRKLLGFATCSTFNAINGKPFKSLVVSRLAVLPHYQRLGIGTNLLSRCAYIAEVISSYSLDGSVTPVVGLKTEQQICIFRSMGWGKVLNLDAAIKTNMVWVTQDDY